MLAALTLSLMTTTAIVDRLDTPEKPEPLDLLARHLEVTGGMSNHAGVVGMHRVWDMKTEDFEGTLEMNWSAEGHRSVLKAGDGSSTMAWGEDDQGSWQSGTDGSFDALASADALIERIQADPAALLRHSDYFKRLATANYVRLPSGNAWRVLAAPKLGKVVTFFFDEETGRLVGAEYYSRGEDGKKLQTETTYSDWRAFGPITMAYSMTETSTGHQASMQLKTVDVRPIKPAELARVAGSVQAPDSDAVAKTPITPATPGDPMVAKDQHRVLLSLIGDTVTMPDGSEIASSAIGSSTNVLLYFTAKWCPPCRAFTPNLVKYAMDHPSGDFVVVLVSSDRSRDDMLAYMQSYNMPFVAVDFDKAAGVKTKWGGSGIPNLVWLGPDDTAIKGSYETNGVYSPKNRGSYIGPQKVLAAFDSR